MNYQRSVQLKSEGRGTIEITASVQEIVAQSGVQRGLCNIFLQHTSASLIICENADPTVRSDLETFMQRLVPDGDAAYLHNAEGPDDMPAHIRSILTQCSLTIPVAEGRCSLGTWQGIYLWEHRYHLHVRNLVISVNGD